MEKENIKNLVNSSILTLNDLADVNTVVGKPITTLSGIQIIPFSKVTIGNLTGGGEYGDEKIAKEILELPFAGGNGSLISMKPMGFLIDDGKNCKMVRVTDVPLDNLIEKASEIITSLTSKD